jgi:hypothetical protein
LEAAIPPLLVKLIYPIDKSDLDPLRLLHFLAIAVLVARFVPLNWPGLATSVLRGAIRCGENSLEIYCLGVLLSLGGRMVLVEFSSGVTMQIAVSVGGVMVMVAAATLLTWVRIASRQQPRLL